MRFPNQLFIILAAAIFISTGFATSTLAQQTALLSRVPSNASVSDYTLYDYKLSPDGSTAVYRTTFTTEFSPSNVPNRLLSVPVNGGRAPRQLNLPLPVASDGFGGTQSGQIRDFSISPDNRFVVYEADQRVFDQYELYVVPINGGTPKLISFRPNNVGSVNTHQISPDSKYVVYRYDDNEQLPEAVNELYIVPINGGAAVKLSQTLNCFGQTADAKQVVFTPDSRNALFLRSVIDDKAGCQSTVDRAFNLYSVPVTGGAARFLTDKFSTYFLVTSDSKTVVFTADFIQDAYSALELYSIPVTGGQRVRLSQIDEAVGENSQDVRQFDLANPYPVIVYAYRRAGDPIYDRPSPRSFGLVTTNGSHQYNFPVEMDIINYQISPTNRALVYQAAIESVNEFGEPDTLNQLYSITYQNNAWKITKISGDQYSIVNADDVDYQFTPDGQRVIYVDQAGQLFSASIFNGAKRLLATEVTDYVLSPNGKTVVYPSAPINSESGNSLKATSVATGSTQTLVNFGVVVVKADKLRRIDVTADNRRAAFVRYIYDRNGNQVFHVDGYTPVEQLYSIAIP